MKTKIRDFQVKIDNLSYKITEHGLEVLNSKEKALEEYDAKHFSKEGCAKHSLWANVGLSALEFVIGFISGSIGLIADAVHTAVDILASAVTWIGIRIDKETQAAFLGGIILCGIGFFIGFESLRNVFRGVEISFQLVALITITINIAVNGYFSFYKFKKGLGRRFPVMLEEDDYERIYSILEREGLVEIETIGDKLKLTQRGEKELKSQAISISLPKSRTFLDLLAATEIKPSVDIKLTSELKSLLDDEETYLARRREIQTRHLRQNKLPVEPGEVDRIFEKLNTIYDKIEEFDPEYVFTRRGKPLYLNKIQDMLSSQKRNVVLIEYFITDRR